MNPVADQLPEADTLLLMGPEDIGVIALGMLPRFEQNGLVHRDVIANVLFNTPGPPDPDLERKFPRNKWRDVGRALAEAMQWLELQLLVVPAEGTNGKNGWLTITRKGREASIDTAALARFRQAADFPKALLHPSITDKVSAALGRGDLSGAVFEAFKAVEIAVREAGKFAATDIGVDLMWKAFNADNGPLTDKSHPKAERTALANLFAGAIGSYKNPHSHRTVELKDPRDAHDMVLLASHLLRIVDARRGP